MILEAMTWFAKVGRIFFFLAILSFAVQHFVYAISQSPKSMGYPWGPVPYWLAYVVGLMLILIAAARMSSKYATAGTLLLAILLFGRAIVTFGPMLVSNVRNGAVWTPLSELIAMSGASLFLSGMASGSSSTVRIPDGVGRWRTMIGPMLFGSPLIVFGIEHFVYARYVATLVPAWIPGHLFWTYLAGVAFIVAAVAILLRRVTWPATILLGLMFCSWVFLVHAPRIFANPRNGYEWTSGFVALAMSGASWILSSMDSTSVPFAPAATSGAHA